MSSTEWEGLRVPEITGDKCTVWQMFCREKLHLPAKISWTVLCGNRKSKQKLNIRLRMRCINCPGTVTNKGWCDHERNCIPLAENHKSIREVGNTEDDPRNRSIREQRGTERNSPYVSMRFRRLFACKREDKSFQAVIKSVIDHDESCGAMPFTGRDFQAMCTDCDRLLSTVNATEFDSRQLCK